MRIVGRIWTIVSESVKTTEILKLVSYKEPLINHYGLWSAQENEKSDTLTGVLWCVIRKIFGDNWPRYNGSALYFTNWRGCMDEQFFRHLI